jgi:formylmethanofuran dehydrogenase subunit E
MSMPELSDLLAASCRRHRRLCPRQVLGVRMGLAGAAALGLPAPAAEKRLLVIVETDGCFVDGVEAATGCSLGARTLRCEDYGKVAATFVDTRRERAVRLAPRPGLRQAARAAAPEAPTPYAAQLAAYQRLPVADLFVIQPVGLARPLAELLSRPGLRTTCAACGEEIINQREIHTPAGPLCRACAGLAVYYRPPGGGGKG